MRLRLRAGLERQLQDDAGLRAKTALAAAAAAKAAEGQAARRHYRVAVEETARGVRLVANDVGRYKINQAGWVEFGRGGTSPLPAKAPLRRGAEAAGLKVKRAP